MVLSCHGLSSHNELKCIGQRQEFKKLFVGGGCIWIIASALWSRVFSL